MWEAVRFPESDGEPEASRAGRAQAVQELGGHHHTVKVSLEEGEAGRARSSACVVSVCPVALPTHRGM